MTEEEAREWLRAEINVPHGTLDRIAAFLRHLSAANVEQNLVAPSTLDHLWARHVVDSAQLVPLAAAASAGRWVDIGAGAGFPGLIAAALTGRATALLEPRRLRAELLRHGAVILGIEHHVTIHQSKAETAPVADAAILSARAVAPLDRMFAIAARLATPDTLWLLPKGRTARAELEVAARSWQGHFDLVPSITDAEAAIVVARDVRPRDHARRSRASR